jgi:hypothetical protein
MSIPAGKQVDVYAIEARLRKEDKAAWQYVKALKQALENEQTLTKKAINKIREQGIELLAYQAADRDRKTEDMRGFREHLKQQEDGRQDG